jgi:hypothetical protein
MTSPLHLPDATSIKAALAGLEPATADADLFSARAHASRFQFNVARIDDDYRRDTRSVIRPDGTRIGELRAELANDDGDVDALWRRLKETDLQITEWRGTSAFVFAPTGPAAADYAQIAFGRKSEWQVAPIANPDYRPFGEPDPGWIRRDEMGEGGFCRCRTPPCTMLMDRIGAIDRELGLPFGWVFLMTHGHGVKAEIGQAIATGLHEQRVRLPDNDAGVLLRWADKPYGF